MPNEPQEPAAPQVQNEVSHAHVGPILGMLVVVLILILGGLYLWGALLTKNAPAPTPERQLPNNEPETTRANADRQIFDTVSASKELDAIYADLESTNLDSLEADLEQIDTEMGAALR